jgi:HPr kinase/phosphorylase
VSVHGQGILIVGSSGIGKSACALDLISNGHQLVADDVVEITLAGDTIVGSAPPSLYGLLEIRGLGICDVRSLFADSPVTLSHQIDLCIEFRKEAPEPGDRLEQISDPLDLLGVSVPRVIFVTDGSRNARVFVETSARFVAVDGKSAELELLNRHDRSVREIGEIT